MTIFRSLSKILSPDLMKKGALGVCFRLVGMGLTYLVTLLITRNYGAEGMGLFAISQSIMVFLMTFGRFGMDTVLLRFTSNYISEGDTGKVRSIYLKTLFFTAVLSVLFSGVILAFSEYIAEAIFGGGLIVFGLHAAAIAAPARAFLRLNTEGVKALKRLNAFMILRNLLPMGITFFLIGAGVIFSWGNSLFPIRALAISFIVVSLLSFLVFFKFSGILNIPSHKTQPLRELVPIASSVFVSNLMFMVLSWAEIILLGAFLPEQEAGKFNVALRLSNLTTIALFAANAYAAPRIAEFFNAGDFMGMKNVTKSASKMVMLFSLPIVGILCIFPSFFLGIFGEEFKGILWILVTLTVGQFIHSSAGAVVHVLQMTGNQMVSRNIVIVAALVSIGLNLLLIPWMGVLGAAIAHVAAKVVWNFLANLYIKRKFGFISFYLPVIDKSRP